jgi:hypothetical protein
VAHLVAHNKDVSFAEFGPPQYKTPCDVASIKNRIVLCGTKSERDTCHNLFDHHYVSVYFDPLQQLYRAVCLITGGPFTAGQSWNLVFPPTLRECDYPYKRLLAWRIRKFALENASNFDPEQLNTFVSIADLSESDEVITGGLGEGTHETSEES